ncbi:hypothetical protein E2C01_056067 [Portunus trituberculatus]|uniref:Uncharacterized protein n=1 Tax=Portunus trituberculatus TaxID=210409 RepID=A0A5B7GYM9_PORTR|nr:hypothetical protein [Portunus trituberculatus]
MQSYTKNVKKQTRIHFTVSLFNSMFLTSGSDPTLSMCTYRYIYLKNVLYFLLIIEMILVYLSLATVPCITRIFNKVTF